MTEILEHLAGRTVIVGSGLAGLMTALTLAPEPVVLVTKGPIGGESSSMLAQGGIAASIGADDRADLHLADTLAAGDGLCDPAVAAEIVSQGPAVIAVLERLGVHFDRDGEGEISLGLEAAHSRRRIVHARGDSSGAAIVDAVAAAVLATPAITVLTGFEARRLLVTEGVVSGLLCASEKGAAVLPSSRVVLATGGIGALFEATTNPAGSFGQGIALAARAGAVLADMEFVQFHPTALDSRRHGLSLISEAVRGEGAHLVNDHGERFLLGVPGEELAPRDVVARAIAEQIASGRRVFLDARCALGDHFQTRFAAINRLCLEQGIDPSCQPIPVRPAAHYHMGGVLTDASGRSSVPGLWVVGETASTGLHGANRLASNSLLEACVMGMQAARDIQMENPARVKPIVLDEIAARPDATAVRRISSPFLGIRRDGEGLHRAMADLLPMAAGGDQNADPAIVALLMAVFALLRTESRGAHARSDFPLKQTIAKRRTMTLAQAMSFAGISVPEVLARSA